MCHNYNSEVIAAGYSNEFKSQEKCIHV